MNSIARRAGLWPLALAPSGMLVIPIALFALAVLVRLVAAAPTDFPANEGSAYYVSVARSIAEGRGLVVDAIWSYATPPLVLPRPAFELWLPMASFIATVPMSVLGPSLANAQLGGVFAGALVAPLAWTIAREAAGRLALHEPRASTVAWGSGIVAALLGPFLVATALPDSTMPFLVFGTLACVLMPVALGRSDQARVALGVVLGLAYLSRMEAMYLGVTFLLLMFVGVRRQSRPLRTAARLLVPVVAGGALVSLPWLVRNALTFKAGLADQILENALFTRNEDVFAYLERPDLESFAAQGLGGILHNILQAFGHGLIDVLLVPAAPVGAIGLVAAVLLLRRAELRTTALGALLISGLLILAATSIVFPVASLWGTFQHASGPLLVGLTVASVLVVDRLVAYVRQRRGWPRSNAWLGPLSLAALTLPIAAIQLSGLVLLSDSLATRYEALSHAVIVEGVRPLISDRPIWLSQALGRPALALPDEPLESVLQLAADFGAPAVVIVEGRGRYPEAFRTTAGRACFTEQSLTSPATPEAAVFTIREECLP
jgi:4-amino-4-deoxy-L-arabinose transferase-like glycosyltransferase